jgi:uncharacterized protein
LVLANVSQLLQEPIGTTRQQEVDTEIEIAGEMSAVRGEVTLTRTDRGILAQGKIETSIGLNCSRCLTRSKLTAELDIAEEYFPTKDIESGAALAEPEGAGGFPINEDHVLDLTEAIRQYAELQIPMKPLCRPDCAGFCPSCGRNLNEGKCDCGGKEADPRWQVLRQAQAASPGQAPAEKNEA